MDQDKNNTGLTFLTPDQYLPKREACTLPLHCNDTPRGKHLSTVTAEVNRPKGWETKRFWRDDGLWHHYVDEAQEAAGPTTIHGPIPLWVKERQGITSRIEIVGVIEL